MASEWGNVRDFCEIVVGLEIFWNLWLSQNYKNWKLEIIFCKIDL